MKVLNIQNPSDKSDFSIDRKILAKIGDSLYFDPEVRTVKIIVRFKDKTMIDYSRDERTEELLKKIREDVDNTEGEEDE
jgi:hypothetical protein